ncbi:hypothetical protein [Sphingomonas sp. SRS2]|uniref:hypothetical protein n=1 Tax=Sphingomonas sp. SRS2 TaxID=133190 RepID=UPI00061844B9|nr:hypothetical protein [Sphingomonas sp. SRS2]KKC27417.1 hypothetical protein WP12_03270 [Sphingomonas sp. SRS2]
MTSAQQTSPAQTPSDIALRIRDQAVALGFLNVKLIVSKLRHSTTRHVKFRDGRGFEWHVRIGERASPAHLTPPDFDAVNVVGPRGQALITAFFHAVLTAAILPVGRTRRPRRRRR